MHGLQVSFIIDSQISIVIHDLYMWHVHEAGNKRLALHYSVQDTSEQKHTNIVYDGHVKWLTEVMERLIKKKQLTKISTLNYQANLSDVYAH